MPRAPKVCEDVGTTKRKPLTPTQRLKLFELRKGICCICENKIVGDFIDEHWKALGLGGGNELGNRFVAHPKCAEVKTHDEDMPRINKAKAQKKAQHGIKAQKSRPIQSAPFPPVKAKERSDRTGKIDKSAIPPLARRELFA